MAARVRSLHVHPVKSCAGIRVPRARLLPRGLEHDRAFMIVREATPEPGSVARARFVTQREHPVLATVRTEVTGRALVLRAGARHLELPLDPGEAAASRDRMLVRVWDDDVSAAVLGGDASAFFSDVLGLEAHLVAMPPDVVRPVDPTYARPGDHVSFADGFPVLLAAVASLADLDARIEASGGTPVPMSRFRANVVVEGGEPWEEERHARVRIGGVVFRMPKRCARCQVTTVDQETGAIPSKEPLRTLATFQRDGVKVFFGQNLVPDDPMGLDLGIEIAEGDPVIYLD